MSEPITAAEHGAPPPSEAVRVDGRRAWRDRNRLAVVDAMLDLFAEGDFAADAQKVAERSGVSRRSVFRYFDDREDLERAAIQRQMERIADLITLPSPGEGPLAERVETLVERRVAVLERMLHVGRVARLRAPSNPVLAGVLADMRRLYRDQVERQFAPELAAMSREARTDTLNAADAVCSFEAFDLLLHQGATQPEIQRAMARALTALFGRIADSG